MLALVNESAEPEKAVASAMQSVIWRVLIFYVGSIFLIVSILPWNDAVRMERPYVSVLEVLRVPGAATIMGAIILIRRAVGAQFRAVRLLAHADGARRPRRCAASVRAPRRARRAGGGHPRGHRFGYAAVVMSYVLPDRVFAFLVNSYGTVAIFVYVIIAVSRAAAAPAPRARASRAAAPAHVGIPLPHPLRRSP